MREWRRVPSATLCGYCGEQISRDVPALFTKLPNVKRERVRCALCVGEAPPDLPARIVLRGETVDGVRSGVTKRMQPLAKVAASLPVDYSARRIGERE